MTKSPITAAFHSLKRSNAWKGKPRKFNQWGGTRAMRKAWARAYAAEWASMPTWI